MWTGTEAGQIKVGSPPILPPVPPYRPLPPLTFSPGSILRGRCSRPGWRCAGTGYVTQSRSGHRHVNSRGTSSQPRATTGSHRMALDLSIRGHGCGLSEAFSHIYSKQDFSGSEHTSEGEEDRNNNNTSVTPINLSKPKPSQDEDNPQLSHQQIQLDIAALNLLCLARLQETAAVLTGRRPLPAHLSSSSFPLVNSNNNRRNHRCDEPGCDKVCDFYSSSIGKNVIYLLIIDDFSGLHQKFPFESSQENPHWRETLLLLLGGL